eukprot:3602184-Rhodomonas_salina.1
MSEVRQPQTCTESLIRSRTSSNSFPFSARTTFLNREPNRPLSRQSVDGTPRQSDKLVVSSLLAQAVDTAPPRALQPAWLRRKISSPPALATQLVASDAAEPA